ncbi:membrane protein insertase YidC [Mycoplasma sp. 4044]
MKGFVVSYKNRSKHYDFFSPKSKQGANTPEGRKNILKKIWKWIKILLIIFVIGTGLAGCVQSFVLRSPVKIGTGFEMYGAKEEVSPNVAPLRYNDNTGTFENVNTGGFTNGNPYVWKEDKQELEAIKNQINNNGGKYGEKYTRNLAFQLRDSSNALINNSDANKGVVYNNGTNYMVLSYGQTNKDGSVSNVITNYDYVTKLEDIYFFDFAITSLPKTNNSTDATTNNNSEATTNDQVSDKYKLAISSFSVLPAYSNANGNALIKFYRDMYQAFINEGSEQFKKHYDKQDLNDASLYVDKEKTTTYWQKIASESGLTEEQLQNASALDVINAFILNFKNNKQNVEVDEAYYKTISKLREISINNFRTYGSYTGYRLLTNKTDKNGANLVGYTLLDNYNNYVNPSQLLSGLVGEAQRPIATYGDYWSYGPFYGIFVWPIFKMLVGMMRAMDSIGGWSFIIAIIITIIVTRLITILLSYKSILASTKQTELNAKKAKIEAKYAPYKGDKQMEQKKRMEINEMYKKNKANPFTALISSFITLPILLVMFRVIQGSPDIKSTVFLGLDLTATSWRNLVYNREFGYLPVILISVVIQLFAQLLPRILNRKKDKLRTNAVEREAFKKSNRTQTIITIVFVGFGVIFQAGLQIYWIFTGIWQICQTLAVYKLERTSFYKTKILPRL